jgi:hypothetical protein
VIRQQRLRQGAHPRRFAGRIGRERQQGRKQVLLLVGMVVLGGGIKVAHYRPCRLACGWVGAMRLQMGHQPQQGPALLLDSAVAGGQHFQRRFGAGGRAAEARKLLRIHHQIAWRDSSKGGG